MFDKEYYRQIWGTIHRHDYCESLATQLIAKYGVGRYLDIGTGCGYLVKMLRDKGCEAWGLELSNYAVAESHGYVRQGDVRDIPFASGFDVVHSQGLWEYLPESDISKAWVECQRVGRAQEHNIDTTEDTAVWVKDFVIYKSAEWWRNRFYPKVLVACANHEVKEYAFARWIDCVNSLDYPNYEVLVVDNSPTMKFMQRWQDKVPMVHITADQGESPNLRICQSMAVLQQKFLAGDYAYWFNLESDVIVPPEAIKVMKQFDADWVSHAYPPRGAIGLTQGIGCSLFTKPIMQAHSFADASPQNGPDGWFWEQIMYDFRTIELYGLMQTEHLSQ